MKQKYNSRFLTKCISPVLASAASLFIAPSLHAAPITLSISDAVGVSSFVNGTNWNPSAPTSSANDYFVTGGLSLRSVANGGDATFLGNSLTLGDGTTSGTLSLKNALGATITINNLTLNNGIVSNNGGGSNGSTDGTFTLAGGVTLVGSGNQIGSNSSSRNLIVTASISGGGTLSTTGGGTVTLSGNNTYTGGTTITSGMLSFANGSLGTTGNISMNGGTLQWNGTNTQDVSTRIVMNAGKAATFDTIGNNVTFGTAIGNSTTGSLAKSGTGTLTLTAANTYSGGTTVTAGTLSFANGSLGTTGNISMNGGTLQWNGSNTQDVSSRIVMNAGKTATFDTNGNNVTFGTAIGSSTTGSLAKTGTGTLTLSGNNTYSGGTNIAAGTLAAGSDGSFGTSKIRLDGGTIASADGTARTFSTGQQIDFANNFTFGTSTTGNLKFNDGFHLGGGAKTATINNTVTEFAGIVADNLTSTNAFTKAGNGTLILSNGGNTYVHKTVIDAGTLSFATNALNSTPSISMNGGTLQWNGSNTQDVSSKILMNADKTATFDTNGNDVTFASTIGSSTTGSLVKTGTGTLTLATGVTYTGTTTVSGGKLVIGGSISTSSLTTVQNNASLGGSGSVGALTVETGGTLTPGNSPGNLTITGDLTLAGTYVWELGALTTSGAGSNFDIITMTVGNANLTGSTLSLNLGSFAPSANSFWGTDQTWTGILNNTGAGSLTGMFGAIDNSAWASLGTFSTAADGNDVNLVWTAVPEPGAALLGSLGVLALLRRRRL